MTRRNGTAALVVLAALTLGACEGAPVAEELIVGPTPPTMGMALFEREQTDADALPQGDALDGLEIDSASTRYIASKEGKSYWVGVTHRDDTARPCLIAEINGVQGLVAACGAPGNVRPMELGGWDFRALMVPDDHVDPGDGWQRAAPNLYVREVTTDVGLAVLERKQTSDDVPPDQVVAHGGLDGLDASSTRFVGSHGNARFYIGVVTRTVDQASDPETLLCFFVDTPDPAATLCGPPASYASEGGELPYGWGNKALLVPDNHDDPGDGWAQAGPNLYVFEQAAS